MIHVAIAGLSSDSLGLIRHLRGRRQFEQNFPIVVTGAYDAEKGSPSGLNDISVAASINELVSADNVDVIVDTLRSVKQSQHLVREALAHGKHAITSNAALMAIHGDSLMKHAAASGKHLLMTPSLGGMPAVDSLRKGAPYWYPTRVIAALSSSCNMALTRMIERGENIDTAVKSAIELGFAHWQPEYDVSGKISLYHAAVLHYLCFGQWLPIKNIAPTPLDAVEMQDMLLVDKLGGRIQYLAVVQAGQITVAPMVVPAESLVGRLSGSLTGLQVEGEQIGAQLIAGFGADSHGWMAAVVGDMMTILHERTARHHAHPSRIHRSALSGKKQFFVRLPEDQMEIFATATPIVTLDETVITCRDQQWCGMMVETEAEREEVMAFLGDDALILDVLSA